MRRLCLFVDALGADMITQAETPALWDLGKLTNFGRLRSVLGYSSTAHPTIWSGRYPDETGVFTECYFDPSESYPRITDFLRLLPGHELPAMFKGYYHFVTSLFGAPVERFRGIPPGFERNFKRISIDYGKLPPITSDVETIGGRLDSMGVRWSFRSLRRLDKMVIESLGNDLEGNEVLFVYVSDLDGEGHALGPSSLEFRESLSILDDSIGDLLRAATTRGLGPEDVLVFSDHGMLDVRGGVNLWKRIANGVPKFGRDFLFFLNSTIAQLWFLNSRGEEYLRSALGGGAKGHILNAAEMRDLHVDFRSRRYGDAFFVVDPGLELAPNFLNPTRRPGKGMHGYDPRIPGMDGVLIGPAEIFRTVADVAGLHDAIINFVSPESR